jgi:acyl carrier protein
MTTHDSVPAARHVDEDDVRRAVRLAIAETIQVAAANVPDDAALLDLGAQSLDFVDLVLRLEQDHHIELPRGYAVPDDHTVDAYVQAVVRALRGRE